MSRLDTLAVILALAFAFSTFVGAQDNSGQVQQGVAAPSATVANAPAPQNVSTTPAPSFSQRYPRYVLRAGDIFDLTFTYSPEFDQSVSVQPDGFVSLRELGDVHVQGQTVEQATATITKAYSKILREPAISIVLTEFEKPYFIFNGTVRNPGKYEMRGRITVTEAVALAGGFTEASKHSEVYLYRRNAAQVVEVKKLNVKNMLKTADLSEDLVLQPGDVLYVPQNTLSKLKGFVIPRASVGPSLR